MTNRRSRCGGNLVLYSLPARAARAEVFIATGAGRAWKLGGTHAEGAVRGTPGSTAAETMNAAWGR